MMPCQRLKRSAPPVAALSPMQVVCRMAGKTGGRAIKRGAFGGATHPPVLDRLDCAGYESNLTTWCACFVSCPHTKLVARSLQAVPRRAQDGRATCDQCADSATQPSVDQLPFMRRLAPVPPTAANTSTRRSRDARALPPWNATVSRALQHCFRAFATWPTTQHGSPRCAVSTSAALDSPRCGASVALQSRLPWKSAFGMARTPTRAGWRCSSVDVGQLCASKNGAG